MSKLDALHLMGLESELDALRLPVANAAELVRQSIEWEARNALQKAELAFQRADELGDADVALRVGILLERRDVTGAEAA